MNDDDIERRAAELDEIARKKRQRKASLKLVTGSVETFDANGKRVIRHEPGQIPQLLDQVGMALAENCDNLFTYTGRLVRLYPASEAASGGIYRPRGALIIHPVDGAHLTELVTAAALHERYDARSESFKTCDCPRRVADMYLARGHWPELRPLAGFIEAPTLTLSGRLIQAFGYDQETGLYLACSNIPGWVAPC